MLDFETARDHMVDCQVRTNKVTDPAVVQAMRDIPRERFVEPGLEGIAYLDEDIPIGGGRYMLEPMVLARMLQVLAVRPDDLVLDIGTGSGYSAAVLSRLASAVVALEADEALAGAADRNMADLGIDNVVVVRGALAEGYLAQAPYDVIVMEGAVAEVPASLTDQLADGGRLGAVVRAPGSQGKAVLMMRSGRNVSTRVVFDANSPDLPGFEKEQGFVF